MGGAIGTVLSGGGARGAYEFGALEVLAPVPDKPARIIVGTSAAARVAAYRAANAQDGLGAAAGSRAEKWLEVEIGPPGAASTIRSRATRQLNRPCR